MIFSPYWNTDPIALISLVIVFAVAFPVFILVGEGIVKRMDTEED